MSAIEAVLLDIDGTVTHRGAPIPGAAEAVWRLRDSGRSVRFVTNTDSVKVATVAERLRAAGIPAEDSEVFTPVTAFRHFLANRRARTLHLLAGPDIVEEFSDYVRDEGPVDYVVVADARERFDYANLNRALRLLVGGATLVALQKNRYFFTEEGVAMDTGAFVAALEYASGKEAYVIGKPSAELLRLALDDLGALPSRAVMVGDDVVSDIGAAHAVGVHGILVRTGKFTPEAVASASFAPDLVIGSVAGLPAALDALD